MVALFGNKNNKIDRKRRKETFSADFGNLHGALGDPGKTFAAIVEHHELLCLNFAQYFHSYMRRSRQVDLSSMGFSLTFLVV